MTPPRLALWLLNRALDPEAAEAIAGDLTEEFALRQRHEGVRAAQRWFWRQALASVTAFGVARVRRHSHSSPAFQSRGAGLMDTFRQDVRFAIRTLRSAPAFSLAAVLTLAVGIGAATAIAAAANRALLRPLPFPHGERLVFLGHPNDDGSVGNVGFQTVVDWRARLQSFDELAIVRGWSPTLVTPSGAAVVDGLRVNWNFFRMLGIQPALGRDFTAADDDPDRWRVVLISDGLWRRQFSARPDVVGSTIEFNGRRFQIAGVLPPSFEPLISEHFYNRADVWAPLGYSLTGDSSCRSCQHLRLVGRLRPASTLSSALNELAVVQAGLKQEPPSDYNDAAPVARMLHDEITGTVRRPLQLLVGAVSFVLLVACANVAGLLMSRATDRQREIALRGALGASRLRIVRQLLTEAGVLGLTATVVGLGLAQWALQLLATHAPVDVPRLDGAGADPAVFLISASVAGVSLAAFGILPAWTSARFDLQALLRTTRQSMSRGALRARELLMTAQVAMALLLIVGAGLMYRTVDRLLEVDPGFDPRGVLSLGISLVGPNWAEDEAVRMFQEELIRRVRALPGIDSAALAGQVPLGDNYDRRGLHIPGRTYASEADEPSVERYSVTPDYFRVMRIPLREGRLFDERDVAGSAPVVVVGETTARKFWPEASPVGTQIRMGGRDSPMRTIVGVVGDVRHYALGEAPTPQLYAPQQQITDSYVVLVVRSKAEPEPLIASIRRELAAIARDVPIYDIATLEQRMVRSVAPRRFLMVLLGLFAAATLIMTSVGLYGVVSQSVAARRREFGIRLALGARRRDILALVARRGVQLVVIGMAAGIAASVAAGRLLENQLYETTPGEPATLAVAALVLLAVAATAHVPPLRRAVRVDPAASLRNE